jgi:chorismate--pyruvate lyase
MAYFNVGTVIFNLDTRAHQWQLASEMSQPIPEAYLHWLFLPGSLTAELRQHADTFSVEVLAEEHITTTQVISGIHLETAFFSRQVALKNNKTPWVMAHTLIPESSLQQGLEELTHLSNRPLGELLFADPEVKKDNNEITFFDNIWGRRSRYWLQGLPLIVSEYFLPELIRQT